VREIGKPNL